MPADYALKNEFWKVRTLPAENWNRGMDRQLVVYKRSVVMYLLVIMTAVEGQASLVCVNMSADAADCNFNGTLTSIRGQIRSSLYPLPTVPSYCEMWHIRAPHSRQIITISFEDFDISAGDGSSCNETYVVVGPEPCHILCGDNFPLSYISSSSDVNIKYVYQESGAVLRRGFVLKYVIDSYPSAEPCTSDDFECDNRKCIPRRWLCNGADECGDKSDETKCSAPKLATVTPPADYACGDGNFGCIDPVNKVYRCYHDRYKCDGIYHCLNNTDEQQCDQCRVQWTGESIGWIASPVARVCSVPGCLDCTSIISLPTSHAIQLRFRTFQLSDGDYIDIHDGTAVDDRLIGRYAYSRRPNHMIESTHGRVLIIFHAGSSSLPLSHFNVTFQEKGKCLPDQFACGHDEADCYDMSNRCNGLWDCPLYGDDEFNCRGCAMKFYCGPGSSQCYSEHQRCDGFENCLRLADELSCSNRCGHSNGTFLCASGQCIRESCMCDGRVDCIDGSDEISCPLSPKVILSAVVGSLSCALLLVIALGIVYRYYVLRLSNIRRSSNHMSPITAIEEHIYAQRSAPPPYPEAMATSRPYDEYQRETMSRLCDASTSPMSAPSLTLLAPPTADSAPGIVRPADSSDDDLLDITSNELLDGNGVGIVAFNCLARWHRRPKTTGDDVGDCESDATEAVQGTSHVEPTESDAGFAMVVDRDDRPLLIC